MAADGARPVISGRQRLLGAVLLACLVGVVVSMLAPFVLGLLAALTALSATFVLASVATAYRLDADATRDNATREDFSRLFDDLVVVGGAVASVAGIVVVSVLGHSDTGAFAAALALLGAFSAWAMLHTTYAARYARTYYAGDMGIDFNTREQPCYSDFYYFSFNLGMTYQVSDTAVRTSTMRRLVLGHCLLSYVFGTVILAATINLVAGVAIGS